MIKLLDILKEINEGKQVGTLYHFTYEDNILGIFKKGLKFAPDNTELPKYKDMFYISTTRDHTGRKFANQEERTVRITLDGNKISEQYSIKPISVENIWVKGETGSWNNEFFKGKSVKDTYYEERVWSLKEEYLDPKYIIKIDTILSEDQIKNRIEASKKWGSGNFDDVLLKYINDGRLNLVKNFNKK